MVLYGHVLQRTLNPGVSMSEGVNAATASGRRPLDTVLGRSADPSSLPGTLAPLPSLSSARNADDPFAPLTAREVAQVLHRPPAVLPIPGRVVPAPFTTSWRHTLRGALGIDQPYGELYRGHSGPFVVQPPWTAPLTQAERRDLSRRAGQDLSEALAALPAERARREHWRVLIPALDMLLCDGAQADYLFDPKRPRLNWGQPWARDLVPSYEKALPYAAYAAFKRLGLHLAAAVVPGELQSRPDRCKASGPMYGVAIGMEAEVPHRYFQDVPLASLVRDVWLDGAWHRVDTVDPQRWVPAQRCAERLVGWLYAPERTSKGEELISELERIIQATLGPFKGNQTSV